MSQTQVVREFMDVFGEAGIDDQPETTRFTVFQRANATNPQPQQQLLQAREDELDLELRAQEARMHARVVSIGRGSRL